MTAYMLHLFIAVTLAQLVAGPNRHPHPDKVVSASVSWQRRAGIMMLVSRAC